MLQNPYDTKEMQLMRYKAVEAEVKLESAILAALAMPPITLFLLLLTL